MIEQSRIVSRMTAFMYPFILLLGFYIILNGHQSPGGGFQGGAVLATLFICHYLVTPKEDLRVRTLHTLEKAFFILIMLLPALFLFPGRSDIGEFLNVAYLILMNTLIGLKVCVGLTIIFYRFVFYEGGNRWTL